MTVAAKNGNPLAFTLLFCVCSALPMTAMLGVIAQDWVPFHVAARLAVSGRWESVYPAADARDMFDVPPVFRQEAVREISESGAPAFRMNSLTAFVSPPPGALLLAPVQSLDWKASQLVWRLALAVPLTLAIAVFGYVSAQRGLALRWALICTAALPVLLYTTGSGQPSAWLAVAAIVSELPGRKWLDGFGSTALALGILTKATPLIVAVALCFVGRRRLGAQALLLAAVVTLLTLMWSGFTPWLHFGGSATHMARTILTDWNNASVDAAIVRFETGTADPTLRSPGGFVTIAGFIARIALLGFAGWYAFQNRFAAERRVSAIWIGWLAAFQLLWLHYTTVLVPLLACASRLRTAWAVVCSALLSAPLVLRALGADALVTGQLATCAWLVTALSILWPESRVGFAFFGSRNR